MSELDAAVTPSGPPAPAPWLREAWPRLRPWVLAGVAAALALAAACILAVRIVRPGWLDVVFGGRSDRPELQELIAAVAQETSGRRLERGQETVQVKRGN